MVLGRLDNRVAFVAGASRGIGRDISLALARAGAAVAVAARTDEPGKLPGTVHSVADTITAGGGSALPVVCDVSDESSVADAVDLTTDRLGPIDILVANAGTLWMGTTLDTPLKRWDLCLRVNLTGTFLVTKAVLPSVMERRTGSLIAITTTGVIQTELGSNAYWVSKAGIERYYAGLATELAPYGVAVNCLAPKKVVMTEGAVAGGVSVPPNMIEDPEAMGKAAVYLAGQSAGTLTGTVQYSLDLLERIGEPIGQPAPEARAHEVDPVSGGPLPGLAGLRVLDLSEDVAGAYCAKLLADAGATVTKVERPEGHRLRSWSVSGSVGSDGDPDGPLFRYLASSQASLVLDPAAPAAVGVRDRLAAQSDVVIASTFGDRSGRCPPVIDARQLCARHPELVVVSLSAFGLTGPRGGEESSDFLLQALAGSLHSHGSDERVPLAVGGGLAEWTVGTYGALGAVTALTARRRSGRGDLVDVSALECLAITFICYPSVAASMPGGQRIRPTYVMVPGIEACLDGYVGMATITTAQWHTFLDMIERPDLASDESLYIQRNRDRPDVLEAIEHWTRQHTVDEVVEIGSLYRIPTVPLGNGANFPGIDHVASRQLYDPNPRGDFPHPRTPFRSNITRHRPPGPAPTLAERAGDVDVLSHQESPSGSGPFAAGVAPTVADAGDLPLAGTRILDFTAFLAGPMCTQYLASLGADVVKVESTQRADPMRYSVRVDASVDHWYEQGAIFQSANLNKRSVTLDLSVATGRDLALRLAARSDVVVENFTPRVMEQFGLSYDDLRAVNPRIIMVRMPGFGLEGPWRDRPGFAATMEQVAGLAWITGYTDGLPSIPGICDPLAGMHAAFAVLTALEHRIRTGEGQLIELAMIDLAANLVVEQVLEHSVYGHLMAREGNHQPGSGHQGVYACLEPDQWVALRIGSDAGWRRLRVALGSPAWSLDARLDTAGGRSECADLLDAGLASWAGGLSQKEVLSTVRAAGVDAEAVVHASDVDLDEQMNARGYWEEVTHPIVGPKRFPAWPMRYGARTSPWFRRPAPLLGQHNHEVLGGLGLSADELAALAAAGIIGTRPAGT